MGPEGCAPWGEEDGVVPGEGRWGGKVGFAGEEEGV